MTPLLVALACFVGVSALVGAVSIFFRGKPGSRVENRLDRLVGKSGPMGGKDGLLKTSSLLTAPLDAMPGVFESIASRFGNLDVVFQQADTQLTFARFLVISGAMGLGGMAIGLVLRVPAVVLPLVGLLLATVPLCWVSFRRKRRLKKFGSQLPEALDTLARALRAGQSLVSGFSLIASEIPAPLGKEFGRVFEEQNLGLPMEESLEALTERVPNVDLKFFVTSLILQRQTGGDLAEILDKISRLVRERFQIWGQIQALTGEGRLSGIVLLALPVVLFMAVYQLNPGYVMLLFTDPMGRKLLVAAIILQLLGAVTIRKIVNIQV